MHSTMMDVPLSLNHLLERAGTLFGGSRSSRGCPTSRCVATAMAQYHRRTRALASALQRARPEEGRARGHAVLEPPRAPGGYFGIPAAGGVMHTLNLRLAPDEIGWIAGHAQDRFLIVDDILLPLYRQFAHLHRFEKVIVFPFSGAPVPAEFTDYEALLAGADPDGFQYAPHDENDPVAMCYTSRHHRPPQGRGLFAPLDRAAHAGRPAWRDFLGPEGQRRGAAGDADVPRQLLGRALRRGDDGRQAGVSRAAPAPGRPARPDAARAADAVAGRADDLDGPDPGLRARR